MHEIYCLNNISHVGTDLLGEGYQLTDELSQASGILVRSANMHEFEFNRTLRAIARAGAGVNNIPVDRCTEQGIVVFNTPGANANAVKELVLCSLFLGSRGIVDGIAWCRENADDPNIGKSAEKAKKAFAGNEIKGKKLGVIGLGAIGAQVANAALDLGMEVLGYDPYVSVSAAWLIASKVKHIADLDEIFRTCDYISVHVPALPDTVGMVGERTLSLVKPGVVVLNFSRDTLVDAAAMTAALEDGRVKRYITDFATPDVMKMKNAIVLPHLGASSEEAEDNCAVMAVQQITDYIDNGNITNSVNFPNCHLGVAPANGCRIALLHKNTPGMLTQITTILGEEGLNIENLTNKAKKDAAFTLIDLAERPSDAAYERLDTIEGMYRVRDVK